MYQFKLHRVIVMKINLNDILRNYSSLETHYDSWTKSQEYSSLTLKHNSKIGKCHFDSIFVNNIGLIQSKYNFFQNTQIIHDSLEDCFFVSFSDKNKQLKNISDSKTVYFQKDCLNFCFFKKGGTFEIDFLKDEKTTSFGVVIHKATLKEYIGENSCDFFDKITSSSLDILETIPFSSQYKHILRKIKENPYNGHLAQIYNENYLYELVFFIFDYIIPKEKKNIRISKKDKKMIYKANDIIRENLQFAPTISELSRMISTNEDKLKKGFKIFFKKTIFEALTDYRMKHAIENIKNNEMSIDEIAFESGYKSTSSFIKVFKKKFDITPLQMRKKISKKYYSFD